MKHERPWRPWRWVLPRTSEQELPEQEVDEELGFHLEQRTQDYIARGMSPEAARNAAAQRFGNVARVRAVSASLLASERAAEQRRTLWRVSSLDVKLGLRMLAKYPALSIIAVLGLSLAVTIGAGYFAFIGAMMDSTLPIEDGNRVVVIQNRVVAGPDKGDTDRASEHDFVQWRASSLKSIKELAAFRDESYNLIAAGRAPRLVRAAAMTASGFRLTRVAPIIGRPILEEDERAGASPVLVIGYRDWQRYFDGSPRALGTTVRLDETVYSIVGVMPDGFAFPRNHGYWVPLRLTDAATNPAAEPSIHVFGRLAPGFSETDARSELTTLGDQMAAAMPQTHGKIRPEAVSFTRSFVGIEGPEVEVLLRSIQIGVGLLLLIVAVNVAIVVYARTATRMGEIAVRTALGASRARIIMQLFVEALVLSVTSAVIGLTLVSAGLARAGDVLGKADDPTEQLAYWIKFGVSPSLIAYVAVLAVLAGLIVGVLPALKATGQRVQAGLQHFASRGASMQLGRTWTALIVLQVAITVAALPAAMYFAIESARIGMRPSAPVASQLVRGTLALTRDDATGDGGSAAKARIGDARFTDRMTTLLQRLEAEPEVSGVTYAQHFPGAEGGSTIEVEADPSRPDDTVAGDQSLTYTRTNAVAPNLFDVLGVRILSGRGFAPGDARPGANAVIVDEAFAERLGRASNVVGRRVRYSGTRPDGQVEVSPWFEIVGIVPAFAETLTPPGGIGGMSPRLYHATAPAHLYPATLIVRVRGNDATAFAPKWREITATVDPILKLERVNGVLPAWNGERLAFRMLAAAIIAGTASVLLLSAAGIYAMMSFTVSRRRREIGIRAALGADARRVVTGIFGRASAQLGAGIGAGLAVASAFEWLGPGGTMGGHAHIILPAVVALMFTVGLLAALGPARRGLAVQPTEALREE
jgi:putative ABC transport system permease protein